MSTTQPIRDLTHVRALSNHYLNKGEHRNHRLIILGLHTALRISDLLPLRWRDVYDFRHGCPLKTFSLYEQKTDKDKTVAINGAIVNVLNLSATDARPNEFLFSNPNTGNPITRTQAYRIIRNAGEELSLPGRISCHSLRKTFGYHSWQNGVSPAVLMEIFNHSSLNHTRRYLGVSQDDLNAVYMGMEY